MNVFKERFDPDIEKKLSVLENVPARDPEAANRGRARFLAEARTLTLPIQGGESARHGWLGALVAVFAGNRRAHALAVLASITLVVVFLLGSTSATVYAAQGSMPGQILYGVKLLSEDVRLSLTSNPQAELKLLSELVNRRIEEIDFLVAVGNDVPDAVINRLEVQLDQALSIAEAIDEEGVQVWRRKNDQDQGRTRWADEEKDFPEEEEQVCRDVEGNCLDVSEGEPGGGSGDEPGTPPEEKPGNAYGPSQQEPAAEPSGGVWGPGEPQLQPSEPPGNAWGPGSEGSDESEPSYGPGEYQLQPTEEPPGDAWGPGPQQPTEEPSGSTYGPSPSSSSGDSGSSGDGDSSSSGDSSKKEP